MIKDFKYLLILQFYLYQFELLKLADVIRENL